MKEQIRQAIIESSVEGHVDLVDLTKKLLNLHSVIKCGYNKCTKEAEYHYCEDCMEELSDNISHGL